MPTISVAVCHLDNHIFTWLTVISGGEAEKLAMRYREFNLRALLEAAAKSLAVGANVRYSAPRTLLGSCLTLQCRYKAR